MILLDIVFDVLHCLVVYWLSMGDGLVVGRGLFWKHRYVFLLFEVSVFVVFAWKKLMKMKVGETCFVFGR